MKILNKAELKGYCKKYPKALIIAFFLLFIGAKSQAQVLVVDEATTNQEVLGLVNNILVGSCVNVSNITYSNLIFGNSNPRGAAGEFSSGLSHIGFENGVLLTTGRANNAIGPNDAANESRSNSPAGGDPDLADLIGVFQSQTYDAAILEFDFYPLSDTIRFRYVFASEEYPEYVNSNFNDVFGFFISGPGINGPYTNNAENIALIPGTTTPVAINNVNNGQTNTPPSTGPCENCQYYYENNTFPALGEVQYDAWTTPLTATAIVQKCNLYHIKLAVADVGDRIYDSGVFLEAKSFTAGDSLSIGIGFTTVNGGLYEGCNDGYFTFYRLDPSTIGDTLWTDISITGTATSGVDYTAIPTTIAIPAGQDSVNIYVDALLDGVVEGNETITFTLENFACGCTAPPSATLIIFDNNPPLALTTSGTTTICRGDSTVLTASPTGSVSPYNITWDNGAGSDSVVTVAPLNTTTYTVTVTDICGGQTQISSETVTVLNAEFLSSGGNSSCFEGNSFSFVNTGASDPGYTHSWDFGDGSGTSTDENPTYSYSAPGNYTVTHTLNTGFCTTTETLDIEVFEHPVSVITDITNVTCPSGGNGSVTITPTGGLPPYTYYWTPGGQTGSTAINLGVGFHIVVITDANNCSVNDTAEVIQQDDTPPTAVCQDVTIYLDGSGNASITTTDIDNGSSDNCGIASMSLSQTSFTCINVGANTVTLTVTDTDGNTATCDATVTVQDTISPTAVCQNVTAYLDGSGNVTVNASDVDNGSSDACGIASLALSPNSFTCADLGGNVVTLTVTDNNGNVSTCNATVTVADTIAPVASCNGITVYLDASGNASIVAADVDGGSTDNCSIASLNVSPNTFTCADLGNNTVTLTVTDQSGNVSTCNAGVFVDDTINPVAVCQDITVYVDASGTVNITGADIDGGSVDNCAGFVLSASPSSFDCDDLGPNTVTLTVTDADGNTATCSATVTLIDTIPPTVICQPDTVYVDASGNATVAAFDLNNGSFDNCGLASGSVSPSSFTCNEVGNNSVTLTVLDDSGNFADCNTTVTVLDTIPPTAICQDITVYLNAAGTASITTNQIDNGSFDNCLIAIYALDQNTFNCNDVGANTVTLTLTDINGNVSNCTATVTVEDTISPTAICQNITVQLNGSGTASITAADVNNGSSDNCAIASLSVSPNTFNCADEGPNAVTLTVTDVNGNTSTCNATVTVENNITPTVSCQNITVYLDGSGNVSITASDVDAGSSAACGIASLVVSPDAFTCANIGANSVTLTGTDNSGNVSSCNATVTVVDTTSPAAICQNITVYLDAAGNASITASDVNNGSTDNCAIASLAVSPNTFTCANVGANTVTLTVTDNSGNVSACDATVTVSDTISPNAVCQNVTVPLNAAGTAAITASLINNGSNDNCGIASIAASQTSFNCSDVGTNTVTLTVTDVNGNVSTCDAIVTVVDNISPTAICQNLTIQLDASGNASITAGQIDNGSTDNCGIASISVSPSAFTCANVGNNTVTLTVTDVNGNISNCTATVTVQDLVPPIAVCQDINVYVDGAGNASITANDIDGGSTDNCSIASLVASQTAFDCNDLGANSVTLTVTDANGNVSTCTATVTVIDTIPPNAVCIDITAELDPTGNVTIAPGDVDDGSSDICGLQSITVSPSSFTCADIGPNTVTLTVTDISGNVSTCTATTTVQDNVNPTALCQNITVQLDASGNASITASQIDNGSSDACGIDTITVSPNTFTCADVGSNSVELTVVDNQGNSSTCAATVTVQDTVSPTAICQDITVQLNALGAVSITASQVNNGSFDNCAIATMVVSPNSFNCSNVGANTVTLTVTDVNGNVSTCTSTVTVQDTVSPTALCQNITVPLDASGNASITAVQVNNGSFDNCGIASISVSPSAFTCANVGPNTVTLTVTDVNGNVSTCTSTVTVVDNVPPTALCQDITVQLNTSGTASIIPAQIDNGSNDACGIASLSVSPNNFNCSNVGANTVTLTVTDVNGNVSSCTATVTVEDTISPTAICQNVTVQLNASGNASITASQINNGSTDNCSIASLSVSPNTFNCANVGTNTVTLTVTDVNGNSSTCTATVSVQDNISPTALCQNKDVYLDASGNASITAADVDNGSFDNCAIQSRNVVPNTFTCSGVGANPVTLTVTDVNGNSSSCVATVTVIDTIAPVAQCQDITIQLDASGNASINPTQVDNGSSDACGIASLSVSPNTFDCSDVGPNTVTLTVTDLNGNVSTCTSTVTVEDNVQPVAVCQNITVQLDALGNASITAAQIDNGSNDACGIDTITVSPNTFNCANVGGNTVTLTVTDVNGNVSTCTATVTVQDTVSPVAICQDLTVQLDASGNASITAAQVDNGSNDSCGIVSLSVSPNTFTCSEVGTNTVTLTVTDVNGNVSTCTATVTVEDTIAPTAVCQDLTIQLDANGEVIITSAEVDNGSFDNCGIADISLDGNADTLSFDCSEVGANTVTLTVTDVNGNISTCTATITVEDTVAPTAVCQDLTIQLNANGEVIVTSAEVDNGSFDNCGIADISLDGNADTLSFDCSEVGTNTVTLTVTDVNGNVSTCTATITVEDTVTPTAVCQDLTIQLDANGDVIITSAEVDNGSFDNCGIADISLDGNADTLSFDCSQVGTNTVTLTVTDVNGNVSTCTATITVEDTISPIAICQDITVELDSNGQGIVTSTDIDNGSNDACGIADISLDGNADTLMFNCSNTGVNTVTLTVTDLNGNVSTCTATVTVEDNTSTAPSAICQDITVYLDNAGQASITAADVDGGSGDNCGVASLSVSPDTFDCSNVGPNTVTLTVTDNSGNVSTCTATVTVMDTIAPTAVCQDITIQLDASGNAIITSAEVDNGSSDICGIADISLDGNADTLSFDCSQVGSNTVTLTVTDVNGNVSSCQATITVEDTVAPTAVCQDLTIQLDANGDVIITSADVDNGSFDNCGIADISLDGNADTLNFDCSQVGANTVTLTVTDVNGNVSTCQATITVQDTVAPTAVCQDLTIQLDANGEVIVTSANVDNGSFDNCGIADISLDGNADTLSFDCSQVGSNTVTLTVADVNGNVSTCTATITVEDTVAPTAVCQDLTIQLDANGDVIITSADVDNGSFDNCGIADISLDGNADTLNFDCSQVGANTVTLTVTDVNGNVSTCTATITVEDTVAPTAVCQDLTIQLDANGEVIITSANVDNGSFDNCGIADISLDGNADTLSFDCSQVGSNTVTLTVTDVNGNVSTCTATITVEDTVAPTAVCQDLTIQLDANGDVIITSADVDNGSFDNCGIADISLDGNADTLSFDCSQVGSNTVTLTVTDVNGNVSTCQATITVEDTVAPIAVCQDLTIQLDANGDVIITSAEVDNGSFDNCGIADISLDGNVDTLSFDCSQVGNNTVTLTVTDVNGNVSTCTATITVEDTVSPTAICQDITVGLDSTGQIIVTSADIDNGSFDNCGIADISLDGNADTLVYNCSNIGSNTVTLTVTDLNGNISTCTATITVEDDTLTPPSAICQDITIYLDNAGQASITAADVDGGSGDNCGVANLSVSPTTFDCSNVGANTVTLTVTDNSGNVSTCTATVTVLDTIAPTAICQDITLYLNSDGDLILEPGQLDNGSFDNCGIASLELDGNTDTLNFDCSTVGSNTVTLIVTDVNGNVSTCQSTVTVIDTVAPQAVCQDITVYLQADGTVNISTNDVDGGSSDSCGIVDTWVNPNSFSCTEVGVQTATLYILDANGNLDSCFASVTVIDTVPPALLCNDITVSLDSTGNASIIPSDVILDANDACFIDSMSVVPNSFDCSNVGANTVTVTVIDGNGNVSTCQSVVTIEDTIAPTAVCQDLTIQLDANGEVIITSAEVDNGSFDNCGIADIALDGNADTLNFDCSQVGANTVTLIVTDVNGNVSTCAATVTVEDTVAPTAICQDITVQLDANGEVIVLPAQIDNGSFDNCGIATLELDSNSSSLNFDCSNVGTNTVTLIVTDDNGNVSTCQATVTIEDTISPTAICQDITVQLDPNGGLVLTPDMIDNGSFDNCGIASLELDGNADTLTFDCSTIGTNTVTLIVTDVNGNVTTCQSTITVVDTVAPTVICQDITVQLNSVGTATITAAMVDNGSTDSCGIASMTVSPSSFNCSNVGLNTVTLTVTDVNGNVSTCQTTVTIEDTVPPVPICQNLVVNLDSTGNASIIADQIDFASTDNCGIDTMFVTPSTFDCNDLDSNVVTLTVVDIHGNSATCSSIVLVRDVTAPEFTSCPSNIVVSPDSSNCSPTVTWNTPTVTDNCNDYTITSNFESGDNFPVGTTLVSYVVTDAGGNTDICQFTVTVQVDSLQLAMNSPTVSCGYNISCNGDTNGTITTSVAGGCLPYSYIWSTNDTTPTISNVGAGTYLVTVSDANGQQIAGSITLTQPDPVAVDDLSSPTYTGGWNVTCNGASDGSIDLLAEGGATCQPYGYSWTGPNGYSSNDQNPDNIEAGTYTVVITDLNGCSLMDSITITQPAVLSASVDSVVNVSCNGLSDATATVTVTGGTSAYQYFWSDITGQTGQTATGLSAGTYTVTVTDVNGCTATATVTITEPGVLVANGFVASDYNGQDITCTGANDGIASVSVSAGTAPYTYMWSTFSNNDSIFNLTAGSYTVTVTDANGCTDVDTVTVSDPPLLTASSNVLSVTCNGGNDGAVSVIPVGGTAPYTYLWNTVPPQTNIGITNLDAGFYTVTVTDANSCTVPLTINLTEPDSIDITLVASVDVSCNGANDGSIDIDVIGGTQPFTYQWTGGYNTQDINGLSGGTYIVTVTDANLCSATASFTIDEPNNPLSLTIDTVVNITCSGLTNGSATVSASGGTAPYEYAWGDPNNQTGPTATNLAVGTYIVTATDANGCTETVSVVIIVPNPVVSTFIGEQHVSCNGGSNGFATVGPAGGTAPYTYNWSSNHQTQTANGLSAGTYTVTVTDNNGCFTTDTITIVEPDLLSIQVLSNSGIPCNGDTTGNIAVSASGGTAPYQFYWSTGDSGSVINNLPVGNYSVTVRDVNNCTAFISVSVTQPAPLSVNVTGVVNPTCYGYQDGAAIAVANGGTPGYSYMWMPGGFTGPSVDSLLAGTNVLSITDTNGCTATDTFVLVNPAELLVDAIGDNSICGGGEADIFAEGTGGTGNLTYWWNQGIGYTQDTVSVGPDTATVYTVTATDVNGCTAMDSVTISISTGSEAEFSLNNYFSCVYPVTINVNNTSNNATSYFWDFGNNTTSTDTEPMPTFDTVGTYTITLVTTNGPGCADTATRIFEVGEQPLGQFTISDTASCAPTAVTFTNLTIDGVSYTWDFGDGTTSGVANPVHTYDEPGDYTITLIASGGGQCNDTVTVSSGVVIYPNPTADFIYDYNDPFQPDGNVIFTNWSSGASDYLWAFGDGDSSIVIDPEHFFSEPGQFSVVLTAYNEFGCEDTAMTTITVDYLKGLQVPNAFMLNGDPGTNLFLPVGRAVAEYHATVFDKWGNLLWESSALENGSPSEGWDGTYKGVPVPMGAYIWKIDAIFDDGTVWEGMEFSNGRIDKTGSVMVIR